MKISPSHSAFVPPPAHRPLHGEHRPHHTVAEPECSPRRPGCDEFTRRPREAGACDFPRLRYDEYLHRQNLRDPGPRRHDNDTRCQSRDERDDRRAGCETRDARGVDARSDHSLPRIGEVSDAAIERAVERVIQTYLIRALTPAGSRIDFFA